jgi:acyl-ACP thioesterase
MRRAALPHEGCPSYAAWFGGDRSESVAASCLGRGRALDPEADSARGLGSRDLGSGLAGAPVAAADWRVVLDTNVPVPPCGRTYSSYRRVRLSDMDARGRLRLDAVARFLQDVAIDDVQEAGWGMPEHRWFVRRVRLDLHRPFLDDRKVVLTTWCSGTAALAAGRRWSVTGDAGGRMEVDSVWIHLDSSERPARIEDFGLYADAAGERRVSTRLELPDPPAGAKLTPWPLRATDIDLHGHVNNAVHWQAVEELLPTLAIDPRQPIQAELDYRQPLDASEKLDLATFEHNGSGAVAFIAHETEVRAVAAVRPLGDVQV